MADPPFVAEHFTDPLSVRCWATQPGIRRFRYDFESVRWVPRTTVLFPDTTDPDCLPAGVEDRADLDAYWRDRLAGTGMPAAGDLWSSDPPNSSRPLCEAVALVRDRDPAAGDAVCRRLRERAFVAGEVPTDPAGLARLAADVTGIDGSAIEEALADGRGDELVERDLERGRELAERVLADGPGAVETLPMAPRTGRDPGDVEWDPGADATPDEGEDGGVPESAGNGDVPDAPGGDPGTSDGEGPADDGGTADDREAHPPSEPRILAPPTVWVRPGGRGDGEAPDGPEEGVATSTEEGYDALASAVRRFDPRAGETATDPMRQATDAMSGYVAQPEVVERITSEDFGPQVRAYLERFGVAFVAEVAAGVGCETGTCRRELAALRERGVVEPLGAGAWRLASDR